MLNIKLIAYLLCFVSIYAFAGEYSLITNIANRNTVSLNGKWRTIVDQAEIGKKLKFWEDKTVKDKTELLEYNFDMAEYLNVPGDWNSQLPELNYYEGKIWYRKTFPFTPKNNKRYFLYFGAANYKTEVYFNGEKLGEHLGGFTPFNFEITKLLKNDNSVVVSVDNTRKVEQVPTLVSDWKNFGGITRDVLIIEEDELFIEDYSLQLKKGSNTFLDFKVWLNDSTANTKLIIQIPELKLNEVIDIKNGEAQQEFKVKIPVLWTPETPKLYNVSLYIDENNKLTDQIGFRTIEVKGKDILLNGKSIFLRGISLHEENPFTNGRAHSKEEARMMLTWAKELGCNYVRLSHYPHNEYIVRLADEMGLLLWEEIPVYWQIDWDNEQTFVLAKSMLSDVIKRDKNRASLIIWSVANETDISDSRNKFLKALIDYTREKDNTRLISAALLTETHTEGDVVKKVVDDPFGNYADVVSVNQYMGWYGKPTPERLQNLVLDIKFDKPFLFSEFGAGALGGFHADSLTRWSEEYQEWYYTETLKMCNRIDQLRGISPWILIDFQSPRRLLANYQDGYNRKGLISSEGKKKKAFFVLQKYYQNKVKESTIINNK